MAVCAILCGFGAGELNADELGEQEKSNGDIAFFEKHVRPLLVKRCFECHGGTKASGGLSLASANGWQTGGESGPAIVPGKPDESLLINAINYVDMEMPPADDGGKLPEHEIAILRKWVSLGAPDPRTGSDVLGGMTTDEAHSWWAFQPLPEASPADTATDAAHIDQLIQRQIDRQGLANSAAADKRTLLRRLTYDLTGLPPSPDDVEAFVADQDPQAWAKVIERLLASPQYGVHWGRHWLDVVRYADTAGENTDRPLPHAWRYRNWVMDSFNHDLPFDQFVKMQLAGDLLSQEPSGSQRADGIVATGYLAIARRFGHDIDKDMYLTYEDVIDNLGKNFLGLTLGCARCHDHKYDAVTSEDYYSLYGIFESTKFAFPGCEPKGQPRDMVPLISPAEVDALMRPWQEKVAQVEVEKQQRQAVAQAAKDKIDSLWHDSKQVLFESKVDEGESVRFEHIVTVRRGEVVLLTVRPNQNHGADSTLVEWIIHETSGKQRKWDIADLVSDLLKGNSWSDRHGAAWSFLDVTSSPIFLSEQRRNTGGHNEITSWSLGSEPSVFVNAAAEPIQAWTTLPAAAFFVHPGNQRPVGIAWTSPIDGQIRLSGRVTDVHPADLDGVGLELAHLAAELGSALADLGQSSVALPEPGSPPTIPVAYAVVDQHAQNAKLQEQGDPEKLGEEIPRRWLSVFGGEEISHDSGSGRQELAEWISRHPLAARVMVNRIWSWHFGQGLVESSNDFGARGTPPTHPSYWTSWQHRFVQSGYASCHASVDSGHTSYQQASGSPSATDPKNQWLAHFNRRRLSAEELRDSLLATSGQLDLDLGCKRIRFLPKRLGRLHSTHRLTRCTKTNRRKRILMVQRQRRHPFLALFDGSRSECFDTRSPIHHGSDPGVIFHQ
ncbi:MAG: PSD1 and planctomycete cytochrome C domain-containing protein [Pirellulaceae bacterium]